MARTSSAERHRRRKSALALVSQVNGFGDVVTAGMSHWGCFRSVVAKAHKDWLDACCGSEEIDQWDLLSRQVGRLERIACAAEIADQYSSSVGAITALNRMMALGTDQKGFRGLSNHHYRPYSAGFSPAAASTLPINAVILQRNGSGQGQTTHSGAYQHHTPRRLAPAH